MCVTACLRLTTCSRIHTCSTYTNTHTNTHIRTHTHFNTHTHRYFMENVCDRMLELDRGRCFMHKFGGPGSYDLFKEVRLANYYALCNPTHVYLLFWCLEESGLTNQSPCHTSCIGGEAYWQTHTQQFKLNALQGLIHTRTCTHTYAHAHTHTHTHTNAHTHTHTHTCTHTLAHTHLHTHTHTHTHAFVWLQGHNCVAQDCSLYIIQRRLTMQTNRRLTMQTNRRLTMQKKQTAHSADKQTAHNADKQTAHNADKTDGSQCRQNKWSCFPTNILDCTELTSSVWNTWTQVLEV